MDYLLECTVRRGKPGVCQENKIFTNLDFADDVALLVCVRACVRVRVCVALLAETVKDLVLARHSHAERRGVIWPLYKLVQSQDRPVRQPCHTQQSRWQMDKWKWSFVYPHPTQLLKTEPRIKRESNIGCILCKVHMCGNGQSQKDKHYTDDAW